MSELKNLVTECGVDGLSRLLDCSGDKYLLFTRFTGRWVLCVSDGVEIWRLDWDKDELEAHRDLAGISSCHVIFNRVKKAFETGDLCVDPVGSKVSVTVGKGMTAVTFDLYEAKAAEKKVEMQSILFRLAQDVQSLSSKLTSANNTIESLKAQKGSGPVGMSGMLMDLGPKKGLNSAKSKPKKAGMSVINPTSKKRKAAGGVVFH